MMRFFSLPIGRLVVPVLFVVALFLGAGSAMPRVASAAQLIGAGSCGGVGHPNCTNLPANYQIGAHSCTLGGSCDDLQDGVVIGFGSCKALDACDSVGGKVGNGSCNSESACTDAGSGGASEIGDGSCDGVAACSENGSSGGSGTIGNNSCNAGSACGENGAFGGDGAVGDDSCDAGSACSSNGEGGGHGTIGDNSCNSDSACFSSGCCGGNSTVGDNSCNGGFACNENGCCGGGATVGDNSCNGDSACYQNGCCGGGATVGDNSCNGDSACYQNGFITSATIGNYSCNQDDPPGQFDVNCTGGTHADVGDCVYNDVAPALCVGGTIEVDKVVIGNSSDRFDLKIDGIVEAAAVGDGGTTDPVAADPGTHSVGESAVYPARLSDYDARVTCEAYNVWNGSHSHTIVPRTRGTAVFNVSVGDVVTCTITNTKLTGFFPFRR